MLAGLLGSDANFIAMQSIAPGGRAKGTMNLDSDPKNPSAFFSHGVMPPRMVTAFPQEATTQRREMT